MPVTLTKAIIEKLYSFGVSTHLNPGATLPDATTFEPPCSFKWMEIHHSMSLGAFSYAVSGFYFACDIGRYCSFGEQVQIGRHPHPIDWASTSPFFYAKYSDALDMSPPEGVDLDASRDFKKSRPPVILKTTKIGNDVWIGHGAFILPGVTIGNGAVIAAKSVVTKDVPDYAIVAGSPAKIVRFRFDSDLIERFNKIKWWDYAPWQLKGAPVDDPVCFCDYLENSVIPITSKYQPTKVTIRQIADIQNL